MDVGLLSRLHQHISNAERFKQLVFYLIEELDSKTMERVCMILWTIWWRRNQKCWNNKLPTTFEVSRRATESLNDWLKATNIRTTHRRPAVKETERRWCKPQPSTLKCNIDDACYKEANQYCIGACLRDVEGRFINAYMKNFEGKHATNSNRNRLYTSSPRC
jgi:hypothetical protein